jgi:hypothetical protein
VDDSLAGTEGPDGGVPPGAGALFVEGDPARVGKGDPGSSTEKFISAGEPLIGLVTRGAAVESVQRRVRTSQKRVPVTLSAEPEHPVWTRIEFSRTTAGVKASDEPRVLFSRHAEELHVSEV